MANFYNDNDDLRFYIEKGLDWAPLVRLVENDFRSADAYEGVDETVQFYRDILETFGRFVADEAAPVVTEIEREGVRLVDGEVVEPAAFKRVFEQMGELGVFGMALPRELGGLNGPVLLYMVCSEILARADVSYGTHFGFHGGIAASLLVYSMEEGSTTFGPDGEIVSTRFAEEIAEIIAGRAWGAMDITEPDAGSDMAALRAKAEQDDEGNWFVTGTKIFITSGHGKYHVVIARTEDADEASGLAGLSTFLVPTYTEHADGTRTWHAHVERLEEKIGHHASATCEIRFDRTPARLIGERGEGFKNMLLLMNNARIGVGFESLGLCEAAYRMARDYAAERRAFGKSIDRHEMIADYLDEMATDIQGIRALAMTSAYHEEMGFRLKSAARRHDSADSADGTDSGADELQPRRELREHRAAARRLTPLLKYLASEKAVEMARRAIQIHGGVGYTTEYGAEKLLRDALVLPIYEGTSQIQALMAMKDTLGGIFANPQAFVARLARARWKSVSARDAGERALARIQTMSLTAQQHLVQKTALQKFREVRNRPLAEWFAAMTHDWDPKRDFAYAMLHAERLIQILADEAICEILWEQAQQHPERLEVFERYVERAEPRCRHMLDTITSTGDRLIEALYAPQVEEGAAE